MNELKSGIRGYYTMLVREINGGIKGNTYVMKNRNLNKEDTSRKYLASHT